MFRKTFRKNKKLIRRWRRKMRERKRISGTAERPRLCVYRSNSEIYAQLIDDDKGIVITGCSSRRKEIDKSKTKLEQSFETGKLIAKIALERGIKRVVFDRNGFKYHGRVKALAEGAREGGLEF